MPEKIALGNNMLPIERNFVSLQMTSIDGMDDIQNLFKETIARSGGML